MTTLGIHDVIAEHYQEEQRAGKAHWNSLVICKHLTGAGKAHWNSLVICKHLTGTFEILYNSALVKELVCVFRSVEMNFCLHA